jgi:hypothetical protein
MRNDLIEMLDRAAEPREYHRLPGLYRRWEWEQVIDAGFKYRVEEWGRDATGSELYALYRRVPEEEAPR